MPTRLQSDGGGMGWTAGRRLYECSDGRFVTVAAAEPRTWRALCSALGLEELTDRLTAPPAEQAEMAERFATIFATRDAAAWTALAPDATIGMVNHGADLVDDPQGAAREALIEVAGLTVPATPVRLSDATGARTSTPVAGPPELGVDTDAVLASVGYTSEEISRLRADKTV